MFRLFLYKKRAAWETLASRLWLPYRAQGPKTSHISSAEVCRAKWALQLVPPAAGAAHAPGRAEQRQGSWLMLVASAPRDQPRSHPFPAALRIQQCNMLSVAPLFSCPLLQEEPCFLPCSKGLAQLVDPPFLLPSQMGWLLFLLQRW